MEVNQVDAILITGSVQHNPAMYYMTGSAHLTSADLILKRGAQPILFYNPMERDEAAKTGLATKNLADYQFGELVKKSNGDIIQGLALRYEQMFTEVGITSGRLAIYGKMEAGTAFSIFSRLQQHLPGITIIGEFTDSLLLQAMATKSPEEVERIRKMGQVTVDVVERVAEFLTSRPVKDSMLVNADGTPLTIGQVKSRIALWLAERGAENPEGLIFGTGRDAGVPHNSGNAADPLRLGQVIVFDIFPCEAGGGYFYDFTRTWCLGYAPDEIQSSYQDVYTVYQQLLRELKVNTPCHDYQNRACELFENRGHQTLRQNEQIKEGYVHSLGHGVGLNIHERPWFGKNANQDDRLAPGVVFTVEPGLYYPDRNYGIRLEDTYWMNPQGQVEILAEYPLDLVLPMKPV
jgi:Xaa-Pro aminopeptidase